MLPSLPDKNRCWIVVGLLSDKIVKYVLPPVFVSDDIRGRIYRIVYKGGEGSDGSAVRPCPSPSASPGGAAGATREMVAATPLGPNLSISDTAYVWALSHRSAAE